MNFKVGDRVKLVDNTYFHEDAYNKEGTIFKCTGDSYLISFTDGCRDQCCPHDLAREGYLIKIDSLKDEHLTTPIEENGNKIGGGKRFNTNKPRVELLVPEAMEETAKVWQFGSEKYGDFNWMNGLSFTSIIGCILRHIFKIMKGEDVDEESECLHAAHIICNASMLIYFIKTKQEKLDDRYKGRTK